MRKVISILERLETWRIAYESPDGRLRISASNHGRLSFAVDNANPVVLAMVDSVGALGDLSEGMSKALDILYEF